MITDVYLKVKINEDVALLKAIQKELLSDDQYIDQEFIRDKTNGFDAIMADLAGYERSDLLERSGVSQESFDAAMTILKPAKRIIVCWAMGLTQHKNGIDNIFECVNLLLMKGAIGKPGAGTCPVRGHSNVQGDRTVGINHKMSQNQREAIESVYGFLPPAEQGFDVVESIVAMHEQRAKLFMSLGGNFITAASDTYYTCLLYTSPSPRD